jgi:hypothetical protein
MDFETTFKNNHPLDCLYNSRPVFLFLRVHRA